jgi:hypothetical protein
MPAFSHFFLKRLSARSKFSSSWMMTSDKLVSPRLGVGTPVKCNAATILCSDLNRCQEMARRGR